MSKINNKLSRSNLSEIFTPNLRNPSLIRSREGKKIEFKKSYNHAGMAQYMRTMASFANADGGYIIFGIGDSPRKFIGLSKRSREQFESLKIEEFTHNLNEYFQPEIKWEHSLFEHESKDYGIIYTYPLENKPCICKKKYNDKDGSPYLKEGDIYYRYRARTERIRYAELNQIFEEKAEKQIKMWMDLIQQTGKIGIENAALLNLNEGEVTTQSSKVILDEKLLKELRIIKEGEFVEKDGAPTLKLIGEINGISTAGIVVNTTPKLKAISQEEIIRSFLKNEDIDSPFEYIKMILNMTSGLQPIYYYMRKTGKSREDILEYIESEGKYSQTINMIIERMNGRKVEPRSLKETNTPAYFGKKKYLKHWRNFTIMDLVDEFRDDRKSVWACQAFLSVPTEELIKHERNYKEILLELYNEVFIKKKGIAKRKFRKLLCRLDEVIYFKQSD